MTKASGESWVVVEGYRGEKAQHRWRKRSAIPSHFGNPAKSVGILEIPIDFRRLCDPRSHGVCLYRLSFKSVLTMD
jgi:hypothetical protein